MPDRPEDHALRASGTVKSVTARSTGDQYGERVELTAVFDVYLDDPVGAEEWGLGLEDAVRWLRLTLESAKPERLAAWEAEAQGAQRQLEQLSEAETPAGGGSVEAIPIARLQALIALLYPGEMTPVAKEQIERVIHEYVHD